MCFARKKKGYKASRQLPNCGKTLPVRSVFEIKNSVNSRQTLNRLEEEKRKRGRKPSVERPNAVFIFVSLVHVVRMKNIAEF